MTWNDRRLGFVNACTRTALSFIVALILADFASADYYIELPYVRHMDLAKTLLFNDFSRECDEEGESVVFNNSNVDDNYTQTATQKLWSITIHNPTDTDMESDNYSVRLYMRDARNGTALSTSNVWLDDQGDDTSHPLLKTTGLPTGVTWNSNGYYRVYVGAHSTRVLPLTTFFDTSHWADYNASNSTPSNTRFGATVRVKVVEGNGTGSPNNDDVDVWIRGWNRYQAFDGDSVYSLWAPMEQWSWAYRGIRTTETVAPANHKTKLVIPLFEESCHGYTKREYDGLSHTSISDDIRSDR